MYSLSSITFTVSGLGMGYSVLRHFQQYFSYGQFYWRRKPFIVSGVDMVFN